MGHGAESGFSGYPVVRRWGEWHLVARKMGRAMSGVEGHGHACVASGDEGQGKV